MDDRGHLYEDKLDNLIMIQTVINLVHANELHEHCRHGSVRACSRINKHIVTSLSTVIENDYYCK